MVARMDDQLRELVHRIDGRPGGLSPSPSPEDFQRQSDGLPTDFALRVPRLDGSLEVAVPVTAAGPVLPVIDPTTAEPVRRTPVHARRQAGRRRLARHGDAADDAGRAEDRRGRAVDGDHRGDRGAAGLDRGRGRDRPAARPRRGRVPAGTAGTAAVDQNREDRGGHRGRSPRPAGRAGLTYRGRPARWRAEHHGRQAFLRAAPTGTVRGTAAAGSPRTPRTSCAPR